MRFRKAMAIIFCAVLIISVAACSKSKQTNSSSLASQGASSSISISLSSSPASSVPDVSSAIKNNTSTGSSSIKQVTSTQGTVLKQIDEALDTKVTLMLPTSIPIKKKHYLTAATASQATDYKVNFYETNQAVKINSPAVSKGTLIASVEGTKYKDTASAKDSISDYVQINNADYDKFADLGHNIKAVEQAGLGHQQLLWNEGHWYIHIDFPTDSAFQNKGYPDSKQLAKNIVAYLDKNMLPAPHKIGAIHIMNWNTSAGTTVQWQDNQTVYQISSKDPMTALKVAVAMKSK